MSFFFSLVSIIDISGEIPPELGALKSLQLVDWSGNALTGGIPPTIGDMAGLNTLILSYNKV
jgi:Leucine-rich repeat (LRR) protein